jgi:hypothetical protein
VRLAVAIVALGLLVAGCGEEDDGAAPPPGRFVATSRALTPTAHLFADPVEARVDVVVDRRRFDPDRIELRVDFLPYRIIGGGIRKSRRDFSTFTRLRYELTLRCLTIRCVPSRIGSVLGEQEGRGERRTFRFQPARVVYEDPKTGESRHLRRVWWPPLDSISALSATTPEVQTSGSFNAFLPGAEFKSTVTPVLEPSYRLPPAVLAAGLFAGAAALLVLPGLLLVREVRRRRPAAGAEPEVTPLERALRVVEWSAERGDAEERRAALEALAFELDAAADERSARAARELAWSPDEPDSERVTGLVVGLRRGDDAAA